MSFFLLAEVIAASYLLIDNPNTKLAQQIERPIEELPKIESTEEEALFHLSDLVYDSDSFELAISEHSASDTQA